MARKPYAQGKTVAAVAAVIAAEFLEARRLLASVSLSGGTLTLNGDSRSGNEVSVWMKGDDLYGQVEGVKKRFAAGSVARINVTGGNVADMVWIDRLVKEPATIRVHGGNDTVWGGEGNDTIYGGSGNDLLAGYGGNDFIRGEDGNDTLFGSSGNNFLDGGSGDDMKHDNLDGPWNVKIETLEPRQMLASVSLSSGVLTIIGDSTVGNKQNVWVSGSTLYAENNSLRKSYSASSVSSIKIYGGDRADNIWIEPEVTKKSTIWGKGGNDTVYGGSGNDTVYGSSGNDLLLGYGGNDSMRGETGNDTLYGGAGTDYLDGGDGDDFKYDSLNDPWSTAPAPTPTDDDDDSSGGGSIPTDSSAASPNAVITATTSRSINAGQAVHFHALSSSLGKGTPLTARYQWEFGDSNGRYNKLDGFNVAHSYSSPGTYTVKLTITNEGGKVDTTTTSVSVGSASRKVIYVSASGSDSNSGTSSSSPIKSFSKVVGMVYGQDNYEILFKRGETFNTSTGMRINGSNVVVGAYGSGNRPRLNYNGSSGGYPNLFSTSGGNTITIRDLSMTSTHDALQAVSATGDNVSVIGNEFLDVNYAVNANQEPSGLLVQDNTAPLKDTLNYFAWVQGSDQVYLGNTVANVYSHVIRIGDADRVMIAHNNLSNPNEGGTTRGTLTIHQGSYVYAANNTLSGGKVTIGPLGEGDGLDDKGARYSWGVFENNTINSIMIVEHGAERIMIRNNVHRINGTFAIQVEGYNSSYGRGVRDVTIANNTGINTSDKGSFLQVAKGGVAGIKLVNNLYVASNLKTGTTGAAPVFVYDSDLSSFTTITNNVWENPAMDFYADGGINYVFDFWSDRNGYRTPSEWNNMSGVGTDYFSDTSISSSYAPSSSSTAANAGTQFAGVFTDRNGKIRGSGSWSAGAVEV